MRRSLSSQRLTAAVAAVLLLLGVTAAGCASLRAGTTTLGDLPTKPAQAFPVRDLLRGVAVPPATLSAKGTIIEKCPVAGCWFMLRDGTGTIKVDTKNAGFVVTEIPLGTTVQVAGALAADGGERHIIATGLRY